MTDYRARLDRQVRYSVDGLVAKVADIHGVEIEQLRDTSDLRRKLVRARHDLWWLLRCNGWSYTAAAEVLGARHSTVQEAMEGHQPREEVVTLDGRQPNPPPRRRSSQPLFEHYTNLAMTKQMHAALVAASEDTGLPQSELVRRAIRGYLAAAYQ